MQMNQRLLGGQPLPLSRFLLRRLYAAKCDRDANVGQAYDARSVLIDQVCDLALFRTELLGSIDGLVLESTARCEAQGRIDAHRVGPFRQLLDRRCDTASKKCCGAEKRQPHFDPLRTVSLGVGRLARAGRNH